MNFVQQLSKARNASACALRTVLAVTVLFALSLPTLAQLASGTCGEYRGTLGDATKIGMSVYAKDQTLQGSYFYEKHLVDIPLQGKYTSARDISLSESDAKGVPQGSFKLHLAEHDSHFAADQTLQGEVLQGTWTSADGKKSYPVSLQMRSDCPAPGTSRYAVAGATNDLPVEKNAKTFYNAVLSGNRAEAAKYVSFPCTYFLNGKRVTAKDSATFLKDYDQVFDAAFIAKMSKDVPHHMFANAQGIMLADGAVWFNEQGKARNFNNQN